jgi:hypothetical protein
MIWAAQDTSTAFSFMLQDYFIFCCCSQRSTLQGQLPRGKHLSNIIVTHLFLQEMRTTVADAPASAQGEPDIKSAVEAKVNEQYDSDASMAFYEHVMGGGGDDIHYGIFRKPKDGLKQSSQNSVEELARMAVECNALKAACPPGFVCCDSCSRL